MAPLGVVVTAVGISVAARCGLPRSFGPLRHETV
jgi:hypothetical protein